MAIPEYFRISEPSSNLVEASEVDSLYKKFRRNTFFGVAAGYSFYYLCRMALSVMKQPLIDEGVFTIAELGIIGSAFSLVYAIGKMMNGFIADYCNIRRFMGMGLLISAVLNLVMCLLGICQSALPSGLLFILFALAWGANGWAQSMGAPPVVISLSRWYPANKRGLPYSILCSIPYLGKLVSIILIGHVIIWAGWQYGFVFASLCGLVGAVVLFIMVVDNPQSKGLPTVSEYYSESSEKSDKMPVSYLQKAVLMSPAIWVMAFSSAFVYIAISGMSNWGVLFLQKAKGFSLLTSAWVLGFAESFGILGTILAGLLSDSLFKGNRILPVLISGILSMISLVLFLFTEGSPVVNVVYVALFSLSMASVFCIVSGLMALDIVPRRATGAALGIVGISSYVAVAVQELVSGFIIQGGPGADFYDFSRVSVFWTLACSLSFVIPVLTWNHLRTKVISHS